MKVLLLFLVALSMPSLAETKYQKPPPELEGAIYYVQTKDGKMHEFKSDTHKLVERLEPKPAPVPKPPPKPEVIIKKEIKTVIVREYSEYDLGLLFGSAYTGIDFVDKGGYFSVDPYKDLIAVLSVGYNFDPELGLQAFVANNGMFAVGFRLSLGLREYSDY